MITSVQLGRGINQDVLPKYQPEGTYRSALNVTNESTEGDILNITNEKGNLKLHVANWDYDAIILGSVVLDSDEIVIFKKNPTTLVSSIYLLDLKSNIATLLCNNSCLNFSLENQINAIYKVRNGCERVVHFTDSVNDYRVINVDKAKITPVSSCHELQYTKDLTIPTFNVTTDGASFTYMVRDFGGQLKYGTYSFSLRYLDKEDNPTDWIFHSFYVPVGHGTSSEMSKSSMKAASNNASNKFYETRSNKSIFLTWNNLDTRFNRFQLAVIKRTTDDGTIENVDILNPITYNSSSQTFTYTGADSDIESSTTLDDVLVPNQRVETCKAHTFHLNRLFVANVTNIDRDYSTYQRYASGIQVKYNANSVDSNNTREPQRYIGGSSSGMGFMEDEVYTLGIVYIHTDGTLSPVFHIPGRPTINNVDGSFGTNPYISASSTWDTSTISGDEVVTPSKNKAWQVYNTATIETGLPSLLRGLLGYYEINNTYPTIPTCDNHPDGYWGRDWAGNLLTGSKIRHHRMPGEEIVSYNLSGDTSVAPAKRKIVGLSFSSITYPPDVVGHYFVYGDRTGNETVIDKGVICPVSDSGVSKRINDTHWDTIFSQITPNTYSFFSPSILYKGISKQGTHLKITRIAKEKLSNSNVQSSVQVKNTANFNLSVETVARSMDFTRYSRPTRLNYSITGTKYIDKTPVLNYPGASNDGDTVQGANFADLNNVKIYNTSRTNNTLVIGTTAPIQETTSNTIQYRGIYASLKAERDVYTNLDTIQYKLISSMPRYGANDFNVYYNADVFDCEFDIHNTGLQLYSGTPVALSKYTFVRYYLQSDININYRNNIPKTNEKDQFYNYSPTLNFAGNLNNMCEYAANRVDDFTSGGNENALYPLIDLYKVPEVYNYLRPDIVYYSLPYKYDHCKDCKESFPYRVYYSEIDNVEPENDSNRIIKVNNYKDLEGNTGEITDIFTFKDNLYAFTLGSITYIPTRNQQLTTSEGTIEIGTGEVLSSPVKQLKTTDQKYGGVKHFKNKHISEHGLVFTDIYSGTVFLLNDGLKDITSGLRNYFKENLRFSLNDYIKLLTGKDYPFISTSSKKGIGIFLSYDPRHARIIVHKKDYEINDVYKRNVYTNVSPINGVPFGIYWNGTDWYKSNGTTVSITNLEDLSVFNNKSYTVSFSFLSNSWISFHSYRPSYMFNTHNNLYSNNLWEHNIGDYQIWYDEDKQDTMLDIVVKQNPNAQQFTTDIWYSATSYLNQGSVDTTFDRVWVYNTNQSSGIMPLIPKSSFSTNNPGTASVSKTDRKYRINGFKDYTADYNSKIYAEEFTNKYIDKVPVNIDNTKSLFQSPTFKDYFIGLRLYFNPEENVKITTDIINTQHYNKLR